MKDRLFIFNSNFYKKALLLLGCFVFFVIIFDRLLFSLLFTTYDITYRASAVAKPNEIFLVGSSHAQRAIDWPTLQEELGVSVGGFTMPLAGMRERYFAIRERLENSNLPKPKLIVLETSKWCLNKDRYGGIVALLLPYYHKGMFQQLVIEDRPHGKEWIFHRLFYVYSFNFQFSQNFFDPVLVGKKLIENYASPSSKDRWRKLVERPQLLLPPITPYDPKSAQILAWKEQTFHGPGTSNQIDPILVSYLKQSIDLAEKNGVKIVLLETPSFRFEEEAKSDGFELVRKTISNLAPGKYLKIDIPNHPDLFEDGSHISSRYRVFYTKQLSAILKKWL